MKNQPALSISSSIGPEVMTLGPPGTFSDRVAQQLIQNVAQLAGAKLTYASSLPRCLHGLSNAPAQASSDYVVVPVENISEGFVGVVLDHLVGRDLHIVHEHYQAIEFSACGDVSSATDAEVLFVQFVAEGQCRNFVDALGGIQIVSTASNSESLSRATAHGRGALAIVPHHLLLDSEASKMPWQQALVHDYAHNETRFWLLAKGPAPPTTSGDKTSLVVTNEHDRPGLLEQVLHCFSSRKLNLTSIVSRPTGQKFGHCHFFVDVNANLQHLAMQGALQALQQFCQVQILGCYHAA